MQQQYNYFIIITYMVMECKVKKQKIKELKPKRIKVDKINDKTKVIILYPDNGIYLNFEE